MFTTLVKHDYWQLNSIRSWIVPTWSLVIFSFRGIPNHALILLIRNVVVLSFVYKKTDQWCVFSVQAQETAQLEEQLQGWGEVILAGDRIVRWEKPWFPAALMGGTTLLFLWVHLTVCCITSSQAAGYIVGMTNISSVCGEMWNKIKTSTVLRKLCHTGSTSNPQEKEVIYKHFNC